jgi:hypothetical protein
MAQRRKIGSSGVWCAAAMVIGMIAGCLFTAVPPSRAQDVIVTPNAKPAPANPTNILAPTVAPKAVQAAPPAVVTAPAPRPQLDPRSATCTAHADCMMITDNCGMGISVINKAYADNWRAANRNESLNCRPNFAPGEWEAKHTVVCLNNLCGMVPHPAGQDPGPLPPVNPQAR